jgi:hypothetical protein
MEKTAEEIYMDLLRIDSHAKQIKEIMPESGLALTLELNFTKQDELIAFVKTKGVRCVKHDLFDFHTESEIQFENIQVNIF